MSSRLGDLDFHRLQASTAADQAVITDQDGGDGFKAAQFYDTAAEHLTQVVEITGNFL
jgi:hypothetical protein